MNIDFAYKFNKQKRTADTDINDHIRDMIMQVLFTAPGERVNRPSFGCGLNQLVFQPNSEQLAATTQMLVQGSLQQWLGDLIQVNQVEVRSKDSEFHVTVSYTVLFTQEQHVAQFTQGGSA
ncbi:phage baseplate assembly protein W [Candidatus Scalindua japonica]|uniref:Phage baseplate assembly protein W n=1 Tax=Candidatus Scalindua japonica TaxID=1284222 RepID=A0A286TWD6_9BACT|nr:GPW/gp25 family protein [Candidatus Scalindua japonica]GAX60141.1 phage baseplate assembly protein W [Candidatus Scalindua japonica]